MLARIMAAHPSRTSCRAGGYRRGFWPWLTRPGVCSRAFIFRQRMTLAGIAMARRIIDLSIYLENDIVSDPTGHAAEDHLLQSPRHARAGCRVLSGLAESDLPDGEGWAVETVR